MKAPSDINLPKTPLASLIFIYAVIGVNLFVFYRFYTSGDTGVAVLYLPQDFFQIWQQFSFWQFITPIFIHFTEWHLISNLVVWWFLASVIGRVNFALLLGLFLTSAVISNLAQWLWQGGLFGGLSGVDSALIGFLAGYQALRPNGIFYISWGLVLAYVIFLLVVATGVFGVYSDAAHFAGLIWGGIIAFVTVHFSLLSKWED